MRGHRRVPRRRRVPGRRRVRHHLQLGQVQQLNRSLGSEKDGTELKAPASKDQTRRRTRVGTSTLG